MHFIPNTRGAEREILDTIGVASFSELIANIPEQFRKQCRIDLPEPLSEIEITKTVQALANQNSNADNKVSFLGGGSYDHFIPAAIDFLISRSEFYTAYTPYQPEVSQGTLQAIYEYQSQICHLMDMDVANASMYDGATALAEAAIMATNLTRRKKLLVSPLINPLVRAVMQTYLSARDLVLEDLPEKNGRTDFSNLSEQIDDQTAAILVQSPNFPGVIEDLNGIASVIHAKNALLVMSVDPISLALLKTPGELGADIAVAEGQPLGIHQSFGGPYLGIFTTRRTFVRSMPGRIVGQTQDVDGKRGYVLVLQTREQHIRREKATSNICTNQGLMALAATIYLALMGKNGLRKTADLCLNNSHYLAQEIAGLPGYTLPFQGQPFFKEFVIKTPRPVREIISAAHATGFFAGIDLGKYRPEWQNYLLIAVTEKRSQQEMDDFVKFLTKF
ncbi:MAG: aminomethyl-transferring glycine dehydrogenase subunit GcvPA [Candidatus Neomarinimicrobiota bacterium]